MSQLKAQSSVKLSVRPAGIDDFDLAFAILQEAAGWLTGKGIRQWPERFQAKTVAEPIKAGKLHLAEVDGRVAGLLVLQWADPVLWGERPDDAAYVHKLTVRQVYRGLGLGYQLLNWAEHRARSSGRTYLRPDCVSSNSRLRSYYEVAGFQYCGVVRSHTHLVARYQRRVAVMPV